MSENKKGALAGSAPSQSELGGLFGLKHFLLIRAANGNRAGLQGFRNFALQRNMQQAMVQISAGHFNVIGKLEAALKIAGRNALVQVFGLFRRFFSLFAGNREGIALHFEVNVGGSKAGKGNGDAVFVLANPLNIIGRIRRGFETCGIIKHAGKMVKSDAGTIKRCKIKHLHSPEAMYLRRTHNWHPLQKR